MKNQFIQRIHAIKTSLKWLSILIILIMVISETSFAQVAINTDGSDPNSKAILDISASDMGILVPRMTTAQRASFEATLSSNEEGMMVFDTETNSFYFYNGTAFDSISNGVIAELQDEDGDTKVVVEDSPDEDKIKFYAEGSQCFSFSYQHINNSGNNLFVGNSAGSEILSSGLYNTGIGYYALQDLEGGDYNTAIGDRALRSCTNGNYNTAVGKNAMYHSTGSYNVALGREALYSNAGSYNIAIGIEPLHSNASGINNIAIGNNSLDDNETGNYNIALGKYSLKDNESGSRNIAIGNNAAQKSTNISSLVAIGDSALYNNGTGANQSYHGTENTAIGSKSMLSNTTGYKNTSIGYKSLYNNVDGYYNVAIGTSALGENTMGVYNTAVGSKAMLNNTDGNYNTSIGYKSMFSNTTGSFNLASGYMSLNNNTTGDFNTGIGNQSLGENTTGSHNTAIGSSTLEENTIGDYNSAIGNQALEGNTEGSANTAAGSMALMSNTTGNYNSAFGRISLSKNESGSNNTSFGYKSLYYATGNNNVAIGSSAADNITSGSNNIIIGYDIDAPSPTNSNQLSIGNLIFGEGVNGTGTTISSGNIGIGTNDPQHKLDVRGDLQLKNTSGDVDIILDGTTNLCEVQFQKNGTYMGALGYSLTSDYLYLYEGGNVVLKDGNLGVGTLTPGYRLQVGNSGDGSTARANAWNTFSDARLKTNLSTIEDPMEKIEQVSGYYYYWKDGEDQDRQVGVIAQEIEEILPEIVSTDAEGIKSVDYSKITPLLIEAMKEQQTTISNQNNAISDQNNTISDQNEMIQELTQRINHLEQKIK